MVYRQAADRRAPRRRLAALRGWTALLSTLTLAACTPSPQTTLFPLDAGHRWRYQVRTEMDDGSVALDTQTLSTTGRETLESGPAWRRRSDAGVDYWLRSDDTGIVRVASKSDLDPQPLPDTPPRYVLKTPLVVGTSWQNSTTAYLLRRHQEFPPEIRHTHPAVPMTYQIDAVEQSVQVPAGRFEHCLRVRGSASLRLFADPVQGWKDMPLTTLEWYCPGAGLVRLERLEPARSTFLTGGRLTMELTEWQ